MEDCLSKGLDYGEHGSRLRKMNLHLHSFDMSFSPLLLRQTSPLLTPTSAWSKTRLGLHITFIYSIITHQRLTAPGLTTSSFSDVGDPSLRDTLLASMAGAVGVDEVGVVGRGEGD